MTSLLDVNFLIALLDRDHVHNAAARSWFGALDAPWATCPVTETGAVRILSNPKYPKGMANPHDVLQELERLRKIGRHEFWADGLSLSDTSVFQAERIQRSGQVTDAYLLELAAVRWGQLVTFDTKIDPAMVTRGAESLLLLLP